MQSLTNPSDFANSKSSSGSSGSSADPIGIKPLFQFFQIVYDFPFFDRSKNIKNRTSIKSSQNLKNLTPGCPKLDFGAILDDFWHHFFDQFS
jgi:hypothetical protein